MGDMKRSPAVTGWVKWAICLVVMTFAMPALAQYDVQWQATPPIPTVGQSVEITITCTPQPGGQFDQGDWQLVHQTPQGDRQMLSASPQAGEVAGSVVLKASFMPQQSGFHALQVQQGRQESRQVGELAVVTRPLTIMYWRSPRTTRYLTWRLATRNDDAAYWAQRGVTVARWAPGIANRQWTVEKFVERWASPLNESYHATAIDEFSGFDRHEIDQTLAKALIEARAAQPDQPLAVWTIGLDAQSVQAKAFKQAADLVMLECYSHDPTAYGRFAQRWEAVQEANLQDKAIFALWFDRVVTTRQTLARQIQHLRRLAPHASGICFNGTALPHLVEAADELVLEYFVRPVLLVSATPQGQWQARNIGWMTAHDVRFPGQPAIARIEPGQSVTLNRTGDLAPAADLPSTSRYTWLSAQEPQDNGYTQATLDGWEAALPAVGNSAKAQPLTSAPIVPAEDASRVSWPLSSPVQAGKPFVLSFELSFESIRPYGYVAVGLGSRDVGTYGNDFLSYFVKGRKPSPGRLEMHFYRGDIEIGARSRVPGARASLGYENGQGAFIRTTPPISFEAGQTYRFWVHGQGDTMELAVTSLTDPAKVLWRSGPLTIAQDSAFDELYARVRPGQASRITFDTAAGVVQAHSGVKMADDDQVRLTATLKHVQLTAPSSP